MKKKTSFGENGKNKTKKSIPFVNDLELRTASCIHIFLHRASASVISSDFMVSRVRKSL